MTIVPTSPKNESSLDITEPLQKQLTVIKDEAENNGSVCDSMKNSIDGQNKDEGAKKENKWLKTLKTVELDSNEGGIEDAQQSSRLLEKQR